MDPKPPTEYIDDGKDWFFRNGKFERSTPPIDPGADFEAAIQAAGYQRICTFGSEFGFGLQVSQSRDNYLVSIEHEDSTFNLIWIESFADYMEFMRQFGHLGTLAEASATRYYVEDTHQLVLDRDLGMLRDMVRDVGKRRQAMEDRIAEKRTQPTPKDRNA